MHSNSRFSISFRMDEEGNLRSRIAAVRRLRQSVAAAPFASAACVGVLLALSVLTTVWARPAQTAGCILLLIAAWLSYLASLATGREEALTFCIAFTALTCVVADLPIARPGAVAFAALEGALILLVVETATASISPLNARFGSAASRDPADRLRRPAAQRVVWALGVASTGGVMGWLLLSLRSGLSGLGLIALAMGAGAAVLVLLLLAALSTESLREASGGDATQEPAAAGGPSPTSRARPALWRRGHRTSRDTKPA